jgi:transitional endoplasmic reticulum ATPase
VAEFDYLDSAGEIARVRALSPDRRQLYLEIRRSGQVVPVSSEEAFDFSVGTVVLIHPEENRIDLAPEELWPDDTWVGVVRLRRADVTVIDQSGRLRLVPTASPVEFSERNTVEVSDTTGIVRVLSQDPIRFLDLPSIDAAVINTFRTDVQNRPELSYEDFGGQAAVVARAKELIELPLKQRDKLAAIGARPIKGVLFSGPPGTGKTLLARIIASRAQVPFYEIRGPEIFSKWYGESEELLRKLFDDAASHERAIIFFDEIDSVAGRRSGESHEASRRVVAQLLTLMDGFSRDQTVIVIAATNRPQDIDAAMRRPGRFDWNIVFSVPSLDDRIRILETTARTISHDGALSHNVVARHTDGWSGADLAAVWSEAAILAAADDRAVIVDEDYFGGFERVAEQRRRAQPSEVPA